MKAQFRLFAALAGAACAALGGVQAAHADSSSVTNGMSPNYTIEARVAKDRFNPNPTRWSSSTWTYHGAAVQSMSWIKDVTHITSSSPMTTVSCSVGSSDRSCSVNPTNNTSDVTFTWENDNTYVSDINGDIVPGFWNGIGWVKICNTGSAFSSKLGIKGSATACVG